MSEDSTASLTPMVRQYLEIKEKNRDSILFYRIGDFYEMFFEDAVVASKALNITLTSRNKNDPNPVPLCGIPHHSVQPYIAKLVAKGYRVAICDQVEDPKTAKGVVKREVTRVVTPGLVTDEASLSKNPNYLAVVVPGKKTWGLAFLEITTGEFKLIELPELELLEELSRLQPRELIVPESAKGSIVGEMVMTTLPDWIFEPTNTRRWLLEQFQVSTLTGFDVEECEQGMCAAGAVLYYVRETQKVGRLPHVVALKRYERHGHMILGAETSRHLDLAGLLQTLDRTETAMGLRKLRQWLHFPLLLKPLIEERHEAIEAWLQQAERRQKIREQLKAIQDLERLSSRLSLKTANARDLVALAQSLEPLEPMGLDIQTVPGALVSQLAKEWNALSIVRHRIAAVLNDDPPPSIREGGMIRDGVHPELDELRHIRSNSKGCLAAIEERERKRTGINSLKIKFNQVFGYFLEVTTSQLEKVPDDFIRKQTLSNAERYITPELKSLEDKVLGAEERLKALEYELFTALRDEMALAVPEIQAQAERLAVLDALISLAEVAEAHRYVRPVILETNSLSIQGGRHPMVEQGLAAGSFVPNDLELDGSEQKILLITGPNMAGKSTIMRQTGLIVLMAQMGSFVPARSASIGLVDRIFTRVGADDRLARGESTFMVEMSETARILHYATNRSLIILDEIGRGTSTFDGISIAWSVAEYIYDQIGARTLFATHYHELAALSVARPGIHNVNVSVKDEGGAITFLYRLAPGSASHSYGIHVAQLAGLPAMVILRAQQLLKTLEKRKKSVSGESDNESQGTLF